MQNNQNLSAHARRRLNKRLKKEQESKANGSKLPVNPGQSDIKSNTSMTDESLPMNSNSASAAAEKIPAKKENKPQIEEEQKQPAKDNKQQKPKVKDQKPPAKK